MSHPRPTPETTSSRAPLPMTPPPDAPRMDNRRGPRWPVHRSLRYYYWRFIRLRGTPEDIARGMAVGVFAGFYPLFGLQIAIAVVLASLCRGSKIAAAAFTWVSNPLTYLPIYAMNFHLGQWILGSQSQSFTLDDLQSLDGISQLGLEFTVTLFFGSTVAALIAGAIAYVGGLWLVRSLRHKHGRSPAHRARKRHSHRL